MYMWSSAERLPERWHRLFRLGAWGAIIGAPVGGLLHFALMPENARWWATEALTSPTHHAGIFFGALIGAIITSSFGRLELREALHMAATCLSPYLVGLCVGACVGGYLYAYFMMDASQGPEYYRVHVQQKLALAHTALALIGGTLFCLAFTGRVWRSWGAAEPEDLGLPAWPPLEPEPVRQESEV